MFVYHVNSYLRSLQKIASSNIRTHIGIVCVYAYGVLVERDSVLEPQFPSGASCACFPFTKIYMIIKITTEMLMITNGG